MASFLDDVSEPPLLDEPEFIFLVDSLFETTHAITRQNAANAIRERKHQVFKDFIATFRAQYGLNIYPSAQLIFPEWAGRKYFIKETALARLIIKMFSIPKTLDQYHELNNWKRNYHVERRITADTKALRDLPTRCAHIIMTRRPLRRLFTRFTVKEVNQVLDALETVDQTEQINLLRPIFEQALIPEVRWICHIILKKPILVNYEMAFMLFWHPDAPGLFKVCNDLQKTLNYLIDPTKRLDKAQLTLQTRFKFRPQLAHKLSDTYTDVVTKLTKFEPMTESWEANLDILGLRGKFYIEEKMDGDRMILHKKGDQFKFYSRRLKDYTFLYGETYQIGSLTRHLQDVFRDQDKEIILDGEMVAWDFKRQIILPFGTLKSLAIQELVRQFMTIDRYEEQNLWPYYLVFDILKFGDLDLTNFPMFFRRQLLERVINDCPHRLEKLPLHVALTKTDIEDAMKDVISKRGEGLLLKHVQLKYFVDYRNPQWFKVKPEYLENFGHNLDLVVIGKDEGVKNSYMCGLLDPTLRQWLSFCLVANGFTEAEYTSIETRLAGRWRDFKKDPPDPELMRFGKRKPQKWIDPTQLVVLEVRARAVNNGEELIYAVGSSLHGLYCRQLRDDKLWHDADNLSDYLRSRLTLDLRLDGAQGAVKSKRWQGEDSFHEANEISWNPKRIRKGIFTLMEFLVTTGYKDKSRRQMIDIIEENGGKVVLSMNADQQTVILAETLVPETKGYHENLGLDIVSPRWVLECISRNRLLQLEPSVVLKLHHEFLGADPVGDSYLLPVDWDQIHLNVKSELQPKMTDNLSPLLLELFTTATFYFVYSDDVEGWLAGQRVKRFGGSVVEDFRRAQYIVVDEKNRLNLRDSVDSITKALTMNYTESTKLPAIVNSEFVNRSIAEEAIVDPQDYKFV
ncbi:ATP-dependent DNA ligase [Kocuria palustris]|nr:ATP-dependent DNA ligase [Kocuria palustris]